MSFRKQVFDFYRAVVSEKSLKIILVVVFVLFIFLLLKNVFIILLLLVIGAISLLHNIFTRNTIGFELCIFATVFCAINFGAGAGIFVGIFSVLIGFMLSGNVDEGILLILIVFILIGFFASMFSFENIFIVGLVATIVYDIIIVGFYILMGSSPIKNISYFLTHVLLNYYIFKYLPAVFAGII